MRQLLGHAAENGYGVPAFNVNNLEPVQAIMSAAAETDYCPGKPRLPGMPANTLQALT